jgi:PAS domain S-box-containing protein
MGFLRKYRTPVVFLLLVIALMTGSFISYHGTSKTAASERWVVHTYEVLQRLDDTNLDLQEIGSGARNGADGAALRDSVDHLQDRVRAIQQLTSDNQVQQRNVAEFEKHLRPLLSSLGSTAGTTVPGSLPANADDEIQSAAGVLLQMRSHELALLAARSRDAEKNIRNARLSLVTTALITFGLLILGILVTLQEIRQRSAIGDYKTRLAAIVDSSDDAIIGKTLEGIITSWNAGAERLYGYTASEMLGKSIYQIVPHSRAQELRSILERLSRGERVEHLETQRHRRDGSLLDVDLTVSPMSDSRGRVIGASAIARDISERKRFEQSLRELTVRILQAQDEERRRIARELHDSTVQKLALLSMNLSQLHAASLPQKAQTMLAQAEQLARECVQELRTLSYVLHPPMLDELGLASALRIYTEGIAQRSGVEIIIEVDEDWPRLPHEIEMALFRVAQESLSNILRHSGSKSAVIRLSQRDAIEMSIEDEGKGMRLNSDEAASSSPVGVGIPGMRERMKQLGGTLTIDSGPDGTTLRVRLPHERRAYA